MCQEIWRNNSQTSLQELWVSVYVDDEQVSECMREFVRVHTIASGRVSVPCYDVWPASEFILLFSFNWWFVLFTLITFSMTVCQYS